MAPRYPWYEIVEGGELEQGDLLTACPIIVPAPELVFPFQDDAIPVLVDTFDVVVMTQSCDLANGKVEDVILCPHWSLDQAGFVDPALARKDMRKAIINGYRPRYSMLEAAQFAELPMGLRIVDFGRIFSLPKVFVRRFAEREGPRLRLCQPYREHLSQSFARFFMRVGLPQNIDLP